MIIIKFRYAFKTLKRFFVKSYDERYNKTMSNDTVVLLWSMANGLMPLGGAFGGLLTGLSIEHFGQLVCFHNRKNSQTSLKTKDKKFILLFF